VGLGSKGWSAMSTDSPKETGATGSVVASRASDLDDLFRCPVVVLLKSSQ